MKDDLRESDVDADVEGEFVPEDDAIIGRALRWSLVAVVALAALAAGVWLLLRREAAPPPVVDLQASAPVEVAPVAEAPALPFTDVAEAAGVGFVQVNGAAGDKLLPETMGSGVAAFDYDRDGRPDLLFNNGRPWPGARASGPRATPALYRNEGGGRFRDVTAEVGLSRLELYGTGVAVGDFDADGWIDVFLAAVGHDLLLRNDGGRRFVDVTRAAGVAGEADGWSTGAGFFDADGDSDLDLFVCRYVRWSPEIDHEVDYRLTGVGRAYGPPVNYEGTFSTLFRNDGGGRFTDVSAEAGIQVRNPATEVPVGKALGLLPFDADGDGRMDLFVANDTVQNFFFHNRGDGTFEETGESWGLAYGRNGEATGAMGVDLAQYRDGGDVALAIGNFANEMSSLYVSQGDPTLWSDEAITEGIGAPSRTLLKFGVLFLDVDLDGRPDLLETNGHLENEIQKVDPSQSFEQRAQLFWNAGPDYRQTFVEVPPIKSGDLARPVVGRGSATADLDGDGDLDVVVTVVGGRPLVLRNDQATGHHWLRLRLAAGGANRDAIGARVELTAGGATQHRQVMPTRSYLSQSELVLTFGLGTATSVDSLLVRWPDGREQTVKVDGVDREVTVEEAAEAG